MTRPCSPHPDTIPRTPAPSGRRLAALFLAGGLGLGAPAAARAPQDNEECLECHGKVGLHQMLEDGRERSLYVDFDRYDARATRAL